VEMEGLTRTAARHTKEIGKQKDRYKNLPESSNSSIKMMEEKRNAAICF
jgi:hypothetical protein